MVNSLGQPVPKTMLLSSDLRLVVTTTSGAQKSYALQPTGDPLPLEVIHDAPGSTQPSLRNRLLRISGASELHVTGSSTRSKARYLTCKATRYGCILTASGHPSLAGNSWPTCW